MCRPCRSSTASLGSFLGWWGGSSRTGWAGWSSIVSLGLSSSSLGLPGMLFISNWTLLSLSWTETHLPCTLVIVRGCMVLAGLLELMLGGGWSPLASPSAGWSACSASTSGSSRLCGLVNCAAVLFGLVWLVISLLSGPHSCSWFSGC